MLTWTVSKLWVWYNKEKTDKKCFFLRNHPSVSCSARCDMMTFVLKTLRVGKVAARRAEKKIRFLGQKSIHKQEDVRRLREKYDFCTQGQSSPTPPKSPSHHQKRTFFFYSEHSSVFFSRFRPRQKNVRFFKKRTKFVRFSRKKRYESNQQIVRSTANSQWGN